jgi:hypothetical protein
MMRPLRNGAVGFAIPSREPNAPQSTMSLLALVWQRLQAPLVIAPVIARVTPVVPVALTYTPDPKATGVEA